MDKDMTLLDRAAETEESFLTLGWKCYKGETENGQPDYAKAVEYFEKARKSDVTKEAEFVIPLARAYRESGRYIQAIHWFKHAIADYGMAEYEQELMELYQKGVAGKELKDKADQYMAEIEKEKKKQEAEEAAANLTKDLGPEKIDYPESFLDSLKYMLAFDKEYRTILENTKPLPVPKKKGGLFGGNKKEIELIQMQNKERARKRGIQEKQQENLYEQKKRELLEEKEALGIKDKLIFEYPLLKESSLSCVRSFRKDLDELRNSDNYSLYSFGDKSVMEFYLYDEGYDVRAHHSADTYVRGELSLFMADQNGKIINKQNPGKKNIYLYHAKGSHFMPRECKLSYLKPLLKDSRYMVLYCDWEYLKEHPDEKYDMEYIWDYDHRVVNDYTYRLSVEESLENYYLAAKDLTDFYADIQQNYHGSIREYFTDNSLKNHKGISATGFYYDERYMKKAVVIRNNERIIAIVLPRKKAEVIVVHGKERVINLDVNEESSTRYIAIEGIGIEPGTDWEYYVGTTIRYAAIHLAKEMKPVDGTEVKPEGLPDKLWRLWIRNRYINQHE